jgi:hypothetical protein
MLMEGVVLKSRQPCASHLKGSVTVSGRAHRLGVGRGETTGGIIVIAFLPIQE